MSNPDYTAVALVVDRSGSMMRIAETTQNAINEFIRAQAAASGKRTIRMTTFDHHIGMGPSIPARGWGPFTLQPRGSTALYDAICMTVDAFGEELAALPEDERPANVVFAIMTDGQENASTEFTVQDVNDRIKRQESEYGWMFLFMAANQDAIATGAQMGLKVNSSLTYNASSKGTRAVMDTMFDVVATASAGATYDITEEDRKKAQQ